MIASLKPYKGHPNPDPSIFRISSILLIFFYELFNNSFNNLYAPICENLLIIGFDNSSLYKISANRFKVIIDRIGTFNILFSKISNNLLTFKLISESSLFYELCLIK